MMTHGSKKNCVLKPSRPFPTVRVIRVRNRRDRFTLNHPKKVEKTDIVWDCLRPSLKKAPACYSMKPSRPFQTIPNRTIMIQSETVKTVSTNTIFVTLIIHTYIHIYIYIVFSLFFTLFSGCALQSRIMNHECEFDFMPMFNYTICNLSQSSPSHTILWKQHDYNMIS